MSFRSTLNFAPKQLTLGQGNGSAVESYILQLLPFARDVIR